MPQVPREAGPLLRASPRMAPLHPEPRHPPHPLPFLLHPLRAILLTRHSSDLLPLFPICPPPHGLHESGDCWVLFNPLTLGPGVVPGPQRGHHKYLGTASSHRFRTHFPPELLGSRRGLAAAFGSPQGPRWGLLGPVLPPRLGRWATPNPLSLSHQRLSPQPSLGWNNERSHVRNE